MGYNIVRNFMDTPNKIQGSIVAAVTPMLKNGEIDEGAFSALLEWHAESGTAAILVAGTTGESPTLSMDENQRLIARAVKWSGGRTPIIGGVGSNSTSEAVSLTKQAAADGANIGLSVVPYYNKPSQEGLFRHFSAVADCSEMPILLYDVPKRCVVSLETDTVARLSEHPNIIGIKDAAGDIARFREQQKAAADGFLFYSGDDSTAAEYILAGGDGVISVTANIAPRPMAEMVAAALSGDAEETRRRDSILRPFHSAQAAESSPAPVKWALAEDGRIGPALRLPLTPLREEYHAVVRDAVHHTRKGES